MILCLCTHEKTAREQTANKESSMHNIRGASTRGTSPPGRQSRHHVRGQEIQRNSMPPQLLADFSHSQHVCHGHTHLFFFAAVDNDKKMAAGIGPERVRKSANKPAEDEDEERRGRLGLLSSASELSNATTSSSTSLFVSTTLLLPSSISILTPTPAEEEREGVLRFEELAAFWDREMQEGELAQYALQHAEHSRLRL